jgi:hypothetical protein
MDHVKGWTTMYGRDGTWGDFALHAAMMTCNTMYTFFLFFTRCYETAPEGATYP